MINQRNFNYVHYRVLELANGKRTVKQLVDLVSMECNIDAVLFKDDIEEFFAQLEKEGVLKWEGDKPLQVDGGCRILVQKYGYPSPAIVFWEVTGACNLACAHCYLHAGKKREHELSTKECISLIDQISEMKPYLLEISGGEAILRSDIFEILQYAKQKLDVKIKLLSNGYSISDEDAVKLANVVDFVHLSLDGIGEAHDKFRGKVGSYEKVLTTAKRLKKVGIKFGFSTTVSSLSIANLEDIAQLAVDYGAHRMRYFYLYPLGRGEEGAQKYSLDNNQIREVWERVVNIRNKYVNVISVDTREGLYGEMRKNTGALYEDKESFIFCRAGTRLALINPEGNIYSCTMCLEGDDACAGNIRDKSLSSIWRNPKSFSKFRNLDINKIEKCSECKRKFECGGGLRCIAVHQHNDVNGVDPFCVF